MDVVTPQSYSITLYIRVPNDTVSAYITSNVMEKLSWSLNWYGFAIKWLQHFPKYYSVIRLERVKRTTKKLQLG